MSPGSHKSKAVAGDHGVASRETLHDDYAQLLQRPAAAQFESLWASGDTAPDAFRFVHARPAFTAVDCVDVFLVDQYRKWSDGRGIPAETYCVFLRNRAKSRVPDLEWKLVAHECVLRQAPSSGEKFAAVAQELGARFPELQERLAELLRRNEPVTTCVLDLTHEVVGSRGDAVSLQPTRLHVPADLPRDRQATILDVEDPDQSALAYQPKAPVHDSSSLLAGVTPFSKLPPIILSRIEERLEALRFPQGEPLMKQGDPGDGLYLLTEGQVEIRKVDDSGESHVIAQSGSGEILGEMALLTDEPRTADVVALTDVTAQFLPVPLFHDLASEYPVIGRILTQFLAERLGQHGRDALTGKTFGRYRIVKRLGRGGMAIVYRAENVETGEHVALKMMSHRLVYDANALTLFQREAQMIESFEHPRIVRMLDRFKAFRSFFIVMEY